MVRSSFVAIASTRNAEDTIKQLTLQCFVVSPADQFKQSDHVRQVIDEKFGLLIPEYQINLGIEELLRENKLERQLDGRLTLPLTVHASLHAKIEEAQALENRVKDKWLKEVGILFPVLPQDKVWAALHSYLARIFQRHGIQAVALLDPSLDSNTFISANLSTLLYDAVKTSVSGEHCSNAILAVSGFVATLGNDVDRAIYISQFADGAFNYFSLSVTPEVAADFRKGLRSLKLFLDTNFLFGILNLHVNPQVELSHELLTAISKHRLPFNLYYHQATQREFELSIVHRSEVLRKAKYFSQTASRSMLAARNVIAIKQSPQQAQK